MNEVVPFETSDGGFRHPPKHVHTTETAETFLSLEPPGSFSSMSQEGLDASKRLLDRKKSGNHADNVALDRRGDFRGVEPWMRFCRDVFNSLSTGAGYFGLIGSGDGWALNVRERLTSLPGQARQQVVRWQASVVDRVSGWRNLAMTREEVWEVMMAEAWARWREETRLQWMVVRSFLLDHLLALRQWVGFNRTSLRECLLELLNLLRAGFAFWWSALTERLRKGREYARSRLRIWRSIFRYQMLKERRNGGLSGVVQSFALSSRDDLCQSCRELLPTAEDRKLSENAAFFLSDPQARALVVVLFFAFSVLLEILAASCLEDLTFPPDADSTFQILSDLHFSRTLLVHGI